jgi:hypothetical protein
MVALCGDVNYLVFFGIIVEMMFMGFEEKTSVACSSVT